ADASNGGCVRRAARSPAKTRSRALSIAMVSVGNGRASLRILARAISTGNSLWRPSLITNPGTTWRSRAKRRPRANGAYADAGVKEVTNSGLTSQAFSCSLLALQFRRRDYKYRCNVKREVRDVGANVNRRRVSHLAQKPRFATREPPMSKFDYDLFVVGG